MQRFEYLFGPRAYGNVLGEIYPANHAIRIKQKFSGACNIRSFRARPGMQDIVSTDDFGLCVGKQRERVT